MPLTVAQIDEAIDALVCGAESYTLPNGQVVKHVGLRDLMALREHRKAQEDQAEGGIVPQYVGFGR